MRQIALKNLQQSRTSVSTEQALATNGGYPVGGPLNLKKNRSGSVWHLTFESEPGLVTPGLWKEQPKSEPLRIVVDDAGKVAGLERSKSGLAIDILGTGELSQVEMRYPIYLGKSVAFFGGWQIVRALEASGAKSAKIVAHGPLSTQAAMWACLLSPKFTGLEATDALRSWEEVFEPGVSHLAVQPRANLLGPLEKLREKIPFAKWTFRGKSGDRSTRL
jgi:hypothetical protein